MPTMSANAYRSSPHDDPLVRHCPHARCRRARQCRWAGTPRERCLAIAPLKRSLIDRLMARLERAIG
jgi:hypothetical protein